MRAIGGYFGLEPTRDEKVKPFHSDGYPINFGRGGLLSIIKARQYKKVWVPQYNCPSVIEYLSKHNIQWEAYPIDDALNPILPKLSVGDAICYINYFGIKSKTCQMLETMGLPLILDLTQAFFYKPYPQTDAFNSARKFVGVPDGGYLFGSLSRSLVLEQQSMTSEECSSLFLREQGRVSEGYLAFKKQSLGMKDWQPAQASQMTLNLLDYIDWDAIIQQRKLNFNAYHRYFKNVNNISINPEEDALALSYPLQLDCISDATKQALIEKQIFVPTYWPGTVANKWTHQTLFLPCDQRYSLKEIEFVIETIRAICR